jgi:DNA polymerase-3 subunit delta'
MTYLIVGNSEENIKVMLKSLLEKLWGRELKVGDVFDTSNPDIHILDGSEKNSIGIEEIKELQKEMLYSPFKEKVQISYILDAKKLTQQAQNSFLKTLEESSGTTAYILITDNEKDLLPTILSRCLKIYTHSVSDIYKGSDISDILSLDLVDAFAKIEGISKEKGSTEQFLKDLELYFQSLFERNLIEKRGIMEVSSNIEQVLLAQRRLRANGNRRLILENLFLHLVR